MLCSESRDSKGYALHDSEDLIFWNWQKYRDSKKISDDQGLRRREGRAGRAQRVFRIGTVSV